MFDQVGVQSIDVRVGARRVAEREAFASGADHVSAIEPAVGEDVGGPADDA